MKKNETRKTPDYDLNIVNPRRAGYVAGLQAAMRALMGVCYRLDYFLLTSIP